MEQNIEDLNPDFSSAHNNRGYTYAKLEKYDKAISDFDKAIELDSNYKDAYTERMEVYRLMGETEKAIADEETLSKL